MARKRKKNTGQRTSSRRPKWLPIVVALALALIVIGAAALLISDNAQLITGTPRLVVEQTVIDEGYQTINTPVRTSFNIRNEGDGPLRVLGEPQVELVEGC